MSISPLFIIKLLCLTNTLSRLNILTTTTAIRMIVQVNLAIISGVVLTLAFSAYLKERDRLKNGDKKIEREKNQELKTLGATVPEEVTHLLHEHPLTLEGGPSFECNACNEHGDTECPRYTCRNKACNFNLHCACGISDEITSSWETKLRVSSSAHDEHSDLELTKGSSPFTCSHCNNQGTTEDRYRCPDDGCSKRIHPICANNPSILISFLHPNHVLELKTRRHLKWCRICNRRGKSNARVYTCEGCDIFIHPECAHCFQYYKHHTHRHTLVYQKLPKRPKICCQLCGKKCKKWNYTCPQCPGIAIHRKCIGGDFVDASIQETNNTSGVSLTSHAVGQAAIETGVQGLVSFATGSPVC